jgi:hypothetical protein
LGRHLQRCANASWQQTNILTNISKKILQSALDSASQPVKVIQLSKLVHQKTAASFKRLGPVFSVMKQTGPFLYVLHLPLTLVADSSGISSARSEIRLPDLPWKVKSEVRDMKRTKVLSVIGGPMTTPRACKLQALQVVSQVVLKLSCNSLLLCQHFAPLRLSCRAVKMTDRRIRRPSYSIFR